MKLKRFSVQNFKNFKNKYTLDFSDVKEYTFSHACIDNNLIKNAIIYGKNSVGKTNLGLAMFDITYHLIDKMKSDKMYSSYLNAHASYDEAAEFSYCFLTDDGREIEYNYKKTSVFFLSQEEFIIEGKRVFFYDYVKGEGDFSNIEKNGLSTLNWEFKDSNISILRYMANNIPLSKNHPIKELFEFINGMLWFCSFGSGDNRYIGLLMNIYYINDFIIRNGFVKDYEKFLNEYGVDEKIVSKINPDGTKSLFFQYDNLIPFTMASSGTNALTTLYYWYKQVDKVSFLFIDEFDAFYHYELAEKIVKLLEDKVKCQTILTSHNTALMTNKIMRPDCYFILTRDRLVSLSNATQRELREGHNLERLYMGGEFDE